MLIDKSRATIKNCFECSQALKEACKVKLDLLEQFEVTSVFYVNNVALTLLLSLVLMLYFVYSNFILKITINVKKFIGFLLELVRKHFGDFD